VFWLWLKTLIDSMVLWHLSSCLLSWFGHIFTLLYFTLLYLTLPLSQVYLLRTRTHTILRYILILLSRSISRCSQWCLTFRFSSWNFLGFLSALIWIMLLNILISGFIYLSWTLFAFSHDKGTVANLLQCDAVSLKVTDNLQNITRVLCLCQPSIVLLSAFVYIYTMFVGLSWGIWPLFDSTTYKGWS